MYLVFDCETTGFPSKSLPVDHPAQARMLQLGWILLDDRFKEMASFKSYVKPEASFVIHEGAFKAHGITNEICVKYGLPISFVMECFVGALTQCKHMVAFNIKFDIQLVNIESIASRKQMLPKLNEICAMEPMTNVCKIKHPTRSGYKWPKLIEAYQHLFGKTFDGAHDALADVRATVDVFKWLVENGHVKV